MPLGSFLAGRRPGTATVAHTTKGAIERSKIPPLYLPTPRSIPQVTKSSLDWETYKAAEGIEGDMQQATKDGKGFLNKQDFLQRCDVRKFESELESRQAKRDA